MSDSEIKLFEAPEPSDPFDSTSYGFIEAYYPEVFSDFSPLDYYLDPIYELGLEPEDCKNMLSVAFLSYIEDPNNHGKLNELRRCFAIVMQNHSEVFYEAIIPVFQNVFIELFKYATGDMLKGFDGTKGLSTLKIPASFFEYYMFLRQQIRYRSALPYLNLAVEAVNSAAKVALFYFSLNMLRILRQGYSFEEEMIKNYKQLVHYVTTLLDGSDYPINRDPLYKYYLSLYNRTCEELFEGDFELLARIYPSNNNEDSD